MLSRRRWRAGFGAGLVALALTTDAGLSTATRLQTATGYPLSTRIAFVLNGNVWVLSEPSGRRIRVTSGGAASSPVWATTGETLLFERRIAGRDVEFRWRPGAGARRVTDGVWSPDGAAVAIAGPRGSGPEVWVRRGRRRWRVVPPEAGFSWTPLAWSPNGSRLAVARYTASRQPGSPLPARPATLWLARTGAGSSRIRQVRVPGGSGWPEDVTWSPDGRFLTVGVGPAMQCISCRADGRPYYAIPVNGGPAIPLGRALDSQTDLSWARGGSYVVIAQARGGRETYVARPLMRIDTRTRDSLNGARRLLTHTVGRSDSEPRVAPNGRDVVFARGMAVGPDASPRPAIASRRIYLAGPTAGTARRISRSIGWTDEAPRWTADGRWVIYVRWRASAERTSAAAGLWAVRRDGSSAHRLTGIDLPPGFLNGFGYYGAFDWSHVFAVAG